MKPNKLVIIIRFISGLIIFETETEISGYHHQIDLQFYTNNGLPFPNLSHVSFILVLILFQYVSD